MIKRVDIKTGFICNNNCRFCVQADNKCTGNRTFEEIKKDLIDSKARCDGVVLTGGEVTIRKDFLEIVRAASQIGYKTIQIQTNGRMLSSIGFCKKVIEAGATEFSPALHGYCKEQHDYLTQSEGSFNQTVKAIKNLKSLGAYILTNTVVVKPNYRDLPRIAKLLVKLNVDQFQFAFVHAMGNALVNFDSIVPQISLAAPFIHKGLKIGIDAGRKVMAEAVPYCLMQGYEDYVAEKIIPETEIRGKEYQNTNDFTKQRQDLGKIKFPQCKKCRWDSVCEGPWKEYPEKRGDKEFEAVIAKEESVYLEITKKCNQRCLFCVKPPYFFSRNDVGLENLRKIIQDVKDPANTRIVFDGGEPTISKDFFEVISIAKKHNIKKINILTNGIGLADKNFVNNIHNYIEQGLNLSFSVSFHSHIKEISEKLTDTPNTFEKTLCAIKNLNKEGIPLSIYIVINKYNVDDLTDFIRFISKFKPRVVTFSYIWPSCEGSLARKNRDIFFRISDKEDKIKEAIDECKKNNLNIHWAGCGIIPFCLVKGIEDILLRSISIEKDFKLVANDEGLNKYKLLSRQYSEEEKSKKKECYTCKYFNICGGIWKFYVEMFGDGELKPVRINEK